MTRELARLERARAFLVEDRIRLEEAARHREGQLDHLRRALENEKTRAEQLARENAELGAILDQINRSLTFRVARPIFAIVNAFRRSGQTR